MVQGRNVETAGEAAGQETRYRLLKQEADAIRIGPADIRAAMDEYDGAADLWQTYSLDGMNLYDVIGDELPSCGTVLEIGCGNGQSTNELQRLLGDEASVIGMDLYRAGSFTADGPTYLQGAASTLPFGGDTLDAVIAPCSLGPLINLGLLHRVSQYKKQPNTDVGALLEESDPVERPLLRQGWADLCVERYVETVLAAAHQAVRPEGRLLLADGQMYVLAENTRDGWTAITGRGYRIDWGEGRATRRRAAEYYSAWLEQMDREQYTEETRTCRTR